MIGIIIKRIATNTKQLNFRQLLLTPRYFIKTSNPFNFYSFEEEIHKLKLVSDQQKSKQQAFNASINPLVKQSIEELNTLYRDGRMFNFQINNSYTPKKQSQEFKVQVKKRGDLEIYEDLKIAKAIKIIYNILDNENKNIKQQLNSHEQSLVLETFFYNSLLSFLCEQPEIFQRVLNKQESGPLSDEIYVLKNLIVYLFSHPNCIQIVSNNPQLFKFIVKIAETLQIHQDLVIPFIQAFLNQTTEDGRYLKTLYDIAMILLPIQDYIAESRFNQMKLGQPENLKVLDLGSISLIIRKLLGNSKENASNRRTFNREDVSTICKLFFCLVRINSGFGKVCLDLSEAVLSNNYEYLTEIEMTSIIYSMTKLQYDRDAEVLFERKIKREMPNLLFDYETKIEKMLQTGYFNHARIPYILYCLQKTSKFRPQYRKDQVQYICKSLMQIVMKHYEKFQAQEIVTIIYSLKLISPSFQQEIETLYRAYFLQLAIEQQKRDQGIKELVDNDLSEDEDEQTSTKQNKKKEGSNNLIKDDSKQNEELDDVDFLNDYMNQQFLAQNGESEQPISKLAAQNKNQKQQPSQIKGQKDSITPNLSKNEKPNQLQKKVQTNVRNQGFNIKMQKKRNTIQYFQQLQGLDILCLFIGIRNINKSQHKLQNDKIGSIFVINQQLFKLFLSKFSHINDNLKIKILYEISYNHAELLDSYLFEKNFKEWIVSLQEQLHKLNNFDLIAIGFIMKKYVRLFAYHIDFWIKYSEESCKRNFNGQVENQRIKLVHLNMSDFYQKCLKSSSPDQKQERIRIQKVKIAYDKIQEALLKVSNTEYNKEYHPQSDEFDYDSFGQYR